jgi:hypothetical protein
MLEIWLNITLEIKALRYTSKRLGLAMDETRIGDLMAAYHRPQPFRR